MPIQFSCFSAYEGHREFTMQKNVRKGHFHIEIMKQHMILLNFIYRIKHENPILSRQAAKNSVFPNLIFAKIEHLRALKP